MKSQNTTAEPVGSFDAAKEIERALNDLDDLDAAAVAAGITPPNYAASYKVAEAGLAKLEASLPSEITEENREAVGKIIERAKKADEFTTNTFREIATPWKDKIDRQRFLWKNLTDRAVALVKRAVKMSDDLIAAEKKKREEAELAARRVVQEAAKKQADAEAKALSAESPEEQVAAKIEADEAWRESKKAIETLNNAPAQTSVKVGGVTVYETKRIDFDVVDIAAFAKAHPDLVEIKRGKTLDGIRAAVKGAGYTDLPETLPGWPGLKLKRSETSSAR